jgi:hypothetical protein
MDRLLNEKGPPCGGPDELSTSILSGWGEMIGQAGWVSLQFGMRELQAKLEI